MDSLEHRFIRQGKPQATAKAIQGKCDPTRKRLNTLYLIYMLPAISSDHPSLTHLHLDIILCRLRLDVQPRPRQHLFHRLRLSAK